MKNRKLIKSAEKVKFMLKKNSNSNVHINYSVTYNYYPVEPQLNNKHSKSQIWEKTIALFSLIIPSILKIFSIIKAILSDSK